MLWQSAIGIQLVLLRRQATRLDICDYNFLLFFWPGWLGLSLLLNLASDGLLLNR